MSLRSVETLDDAFEFKRWLSEQRGTVALDTETTGLDTFAPDFRVRLIQFGSANEAWVIPFERWVGLVDESIKMFVQDHVLTMHNSRYDHAALKAVGITIPWHAIDDTMIALRLVEPHKQAGLKPASVRHISMSAADSQKALSDAMRRNEWTWATVPLDFWPYRYYAAMDTILTARLRDVPAVAAGFDSPIYELEMDVRAICSRMEERGMRIRRDFCEHQADALRAEAVRLQDEVRADEGFSATSTGDLGRWLISNGAPPGKTTKGGAPSTDAESLEQIVATPGCPPVVQDTVKKILRVRRCLKMASSYFDNFVQMADGTDLLHPSIETVAARTGRMSIRDPALQTLPRASSDPDSLLVRNGVRAREDGEVLVSCDYNQVELRMIASFCGDDDLCKAFIDADETGSDFFTEAARAVYSDPTIDKKDDRRPPVKSLFYAKAYGAGIAKMAYTAGVSVEEMRVVHDNVFARYPGLPMLLKHMERLCKESDGWIVTPSGRRVYVDPDRAYAATNGLVQGSAADTMKQAIVRLAHAGLEDFMVVPVHDEILTSVPREDVADVQHVLREEMRDDGYRVSLVAEPSDGYETWGAIPK